MSKNHTWRALAGVTAGAVSMMAGPAAALAAFSDTGNATPQYSAMRLLAPASADVIMTCSANGAKVAVDVNSFSEVSGANYHEIDLYNPSGTLAFTGDLGKNAGKSYKSGNQPVGTWTYEIRGYYKVPGTANMWRGSALTGTLTC
ncbi:hypothetical protein AB4Y87_10040 [Paenarthrobacter sp. RAF54_2]|uniref:SipW-dependent-type signal peptide-containing protein n=1 Tax=Paenarthrobacter sp. RAF54_2 TaxID=3233061 RepID=UPI003F9AABE1